MRHRFFMISGNACVPNVPNNGPLASKSMLISAKECWIAYMKSIEMQSITRVCNYQYCSRVESLR